jgi:hypothetical protein
MEKTKKIPVSKIRENLKLILETNDDKIEVKTWEFLRWWIESQVIVGESRAFLLKRKTTNKTNKVSSSRLSPINKILILSSC